MLPPLDRLTDALAGQRLVLVLDNCEHLIAAVAELAGRVLAAAPDCASWPPAVSRSG